MMDPDDTGEIMRCIGIGFKWIEKSFSTAGQVPGKPLRPIWSPRWLDFLSAEFGFPLNRVKDLLAPHTHTRHLFCSRRQNGKGSPYTFGRTQEIREKRATEYLKVASYVQEYLSGVGVLFLPILKRFGEVCAAVQEYLSGVVVKVLPITSSNVCQSVQQPLFPDD